VRCSELQCDAVCCRVLQFWLRILVLAVKNYQKAYQEACSSHVTHMNVSHVTHMNVCESCHTYNVSHVTHVNVSHVTHMNLMGLLRILVLDVTNYQKANSKYHRVNMGVYTCDSFH